MSYPTSQAELIAYEECSIYEDDGRGRRPKVPSAAKRRAAAFAAQSMSGVRVRIARDVVNQLDFKPELAAWTPFVQGGTAHRKSLGNLAMTVFDTRQQPLMNSEGLTEDAVRTRLYRACPDVFEETQRIKVVGIDTFGNPERPFLGLLLEPGVIHLQKGTVREAVAPELALGDDHLPDHRLHVSLGQVFGSDNAKHILDTLGPNLPSHVVFKGVDITVECDDRGNSL